MSTVNATLGVGTLPSANWQYASPSAIADTTPVEVAAAVAGKKHRVTSLSLSNTDTAVATLVQVLSGSTVIWVGHLANYVALAPGCNNRDMTFPKPLEGAAGEAINIKAVTTSAEVWASINGFTGF